MRKLKGNCRGVKYVELWTVCLEFVKYWESYENIREDTLKLYEEGGKIYLTNLSEGRETTVEVFRKGSSKHIASRVEDILKVLEDFPMKVKSIIFPCSLRYCNELLYDSSKEEKGSIDLYIEKKRLW